ncbi:hypothetical protein Q765_02810 [Flavobacterium rivuli WB 3.3-2 = DSM 21788]|uniref:Uncharacterized protein n=1 Tax=Flavobacterium rivuli WB 3.3-2 = DSM 21788 TaxID=1121895 RepID=A0A0A2M8P0_9FLAO|nr:hypothetical protein [Flavobacterium rivuli]KGO88011.1 hypothetical protein Q765_02810 [Flavobacterium rivuli WB 3.3-2 = DSM 21788]
MLQRIKIKSYLYIIILFLLYSTLNAQERVLEVNVISIKTGKVIKDAKVTLEGFEIPAITAQYDKKKKIYYFNEVPKGYNAVMAYHNEYNEKGFQCSSILPGKVTLRLHDKGDVQYRFITYKDSLVIDQGKKYITKRESYVEDPYKIAVEPKVAMSYNERRDYINSKIAELNLEIALVNPFYEEHKLQAYGIDPSQHEGYPALPDITKPEKFILPLKSGRSNLFQHKYPHGQEDICFILRKKDGSKFKRFNDPLIKKLKDYFTVNLIVLSKKNSYMLHENRRNDFMIRDKQNELYNKKHQTDSSRIFFYDNQLRNYPKTIERRKNSSYQIYEPSDDDNVPIFLLVENNYYKIPKDYLSEEENEYKKLQDIPVQENSIGLGILDQYEYYYETTKKEDDEN